MKKLILTGSVIAATCIASFGQNVQSTSAAGSNTAAHTTATPEAVAATRAKSVVKQLGLTNEQYKGIYDAELAYSKEELSAPRLKGATGPGPGETMQMGMTRDQKFKSVMTAAQYSKYEALKSKTTASASH